MFSKCKNPKKQGEIGLAFAIAYFTKSGYIVSLPLCDNQDYDLIVDNGTLKKVQVKTTKFKNKRGSYIVALRTCGGNSSRTTIKMFDSSLTDLLYVLTNSGEQYLIPSKDIDCVNTINLSDDRLKYKVT